MHDPYGSKAYNDHDYAKYDSGDEVGGDVHICGLSEAYSTASKKAEIRWQTSKAETSWATYTG